MRDGILKGVLWHQGESDCNPESAPKYKEKLKLLIDRFRTDLNAASVPFIIGQLGRFSGSPWTESHEVVNEAHASLAREMAWVGFVSSEGLTSNPDNIHFDAGSLREFGRRYAEACLECAGNAAADVQKPRR